MTITYLSILSLLRSEISRFSTDCAEAGNRLSADQATKSEIKDRENNWTTSDLEKQFLTSSIANTVLLRTYRAISRRLDLGVVFRSPLVSETGYWDLRIGPWMLIPNLRLQISGLRTVVSSSDFGSLMLNLGMTAGILTLVSSLASLVSQHWQSLIVYVVHVTSLRSVSSSPKPLCTQGARGTKPLPQSTLPYGDIFTTSYPLLTTTSFLSRAVINSKALAPATPLFMFQQPNRSDPHASRCYLKTKRACRPRKIGTGLICRAKKGGSNMRKLNEPCTGTRNSKFRPTLELRRSFPRAETSFGIEKLHKEEGFMRLLDTRTRLNEDGCRNPLNFKIHLTRESSTGIHPATGLPQTSNPFGIRVSLTPGSTQLGSPQAPNSPCVKVP
ncbi:hypothetical protein WN48_07383 [Eufriesea mexicana]|uniref:Uncharacterized protein n=1 Tax=Eufriesea mexicana TaxID=516756 RepID=A0A310SMN2_9HYME|nr:hypothetical protein WN48_07383 [Eufriesea mexicana]